MPTTSTPTTSTLRATVTAPEAFRALGINRTTGYRLIADGTFPIPVIRLGRQIRIPAAALERLLDTGVAAASEGSAFGNSAPAEPGGSRPDKEPD